MALVDVLLQVKGPAHGAAGIHAPDLAVLLAEDRKGVSACPVGLGLQHHQAGRRGDGGVKGVAAQFEHIRAGLGSQVVGCGAHAPGSQGHIAPGCIGIDPGVFHLQSPFGQWRAMGAQSWAAKAAKKGRKASISFIIA